MQKETGAMQKIMLRLSVDIATKKPEDFVIATGINYTVKNFIDECAVNLKIKIAYEATNKYQRI